MLAQTLVEVGVKVSSDSIKIVKAAFVFQISRKPRKSRLPSHADYFRAVCIPSW